MPEINLTVMFLFLVQAVGLLVFFVSAVVYFFIGGKKNTRDIYLRTLVVSGVIIVFQIANLILTQYYLELPKTTNDIESTIILVISIVGIFLSFFIYIMYIRTGEYFAREKGLPGSLFLKRKLKFRNIRWRSIIIPIPLLILWTIIVFYLFPSEVTNFVKESMPQNDSFVTYLYLFFKVSILAPITEEIVYRHYAMGLLYKWFGTKKFAIILNILLTSILFGFAHVLILENDWIKILQVIPLGMFLAYINYKRGIEHSIIMHSGFNTIVVFVELFSKLL